jgi:hypothetical protein
VAWIIVVVQKTKASDSIYCLAKSFLEGISFTEFFFNCRDSGISSLSFIEI